VELDYIDSKGKPNIVFKSLSRRRPLNTSTCCTDKSSRHGASRWWFCPMSEFTAGSFKKILTDTEVSGPHVQRTLLCTGKVYYNLIEVRAERKIDTVRIIRFEQLYPLQPNMLMEALQGAPEGSEMIWVQEE